MSERVSNTDIRLRIRLCENSLGRGGPHHMALLDLLDARAALRLLLADVREVRENEPGERMIPTQHQVSDLRVARAAGGGEDE